MKSQVNQKHLMEAPAFNTSNKNSKLINQKVNVNYMLHMDMENQKRMVKVFHVMLSIAQFICVTHSFQWFDVSGNQITVK